LIRWLDPEWNLILLDQRGHGDSERGAGYRVVDYVEDALAVVDGMGAEGLCVYGHSLGAMVAAAVAAERGVRAVILEDPPFSTMGGRIAGTVWQALFEGMLGVARKGGDAAELMRGLGAIQIPQPSGETVPLRTVRDPEALRWSAECLVRVDPGVLEPLVGGHWLEGWDWENILGRSRAPVVLMQGDVRSGGALTEEDVVTAGRSACGQERVFFEGGGHQLHWTHAAAVGAIVNRLRGI
jgi:pimeloyl-ACP methyl ester carboxylesterase